MLLPAHVFLIKAYDQPIFKPFPINFQRCLRFLEQRFHLKTLWASMHMPNCWYLHWYSKNEHITCKFHGCFPSWNIRQILGHDLSWPKFPWFEQLTCHWNWDKDFGFAFWIIQERFGCFSVWHWSQLSEWAIQLTLWFCISWEQLQKSSCLLRFQGFERSAHPMAKEHWKNWKSKKTWVIFVKTCWYF